MKTAYCRTARILPLFIIIITIMGCSKFESLQEDEYIPYFNDDFQTNSMVDMIATTIWESNPFEPSKERMQAIELLQSYFNKMSSSTFYTYLHSTDQDYTSKLEKENPAIQFYTKAMAKVLGEVIDTKPKEGETYIWLLYNMGYIIKTNTDCFGIDISHKYAGHTLAKNLDFLLVTHKHSDHYTQNLFNKMESNKKKVIASTCFSKKMVNLYHAIDSTLKKHTTFKVNNLKISSFNTSHYHRHFWPTVSAYEISLGAKADNLTILHLGDSNYTETEYHIQEKPENIPIVISKYGIDAGNDHNETVLFTGILRPKYVLYSHFNELSHKYSDTEEIRWLYPNGFKRANSLNIPGVKIVIPIWGDKMLWKNGDFVY